MVLNIVLVLIGLAIVLAVQVATAWTAGHRRLG
jgi:hypothetical protein